LYSIKRIVWLIAKRNIEYLLNAQELKEKEKIMLADKLKFQQAF